MTEGILRHSKWDSVLIALSLAHGALLLTAPSIPLIAAALWWNSNTVSHNFIHLPFFRSNAANRIYSLYLSVVLGFPQSLWRERHLAHHARRAIRIRITSAIAAEAALILFVWAALATQSPNFFVKAYLPGYFAGLALCFLHGHFEHAHGTKSNYGRAYNAPFFNDGYHVEHHQNPAEHWTRLPRHVSRGTSVSRWPAVLRWLEVFNLEMLERLVLRFAPLQRFLLATHRRALRRLLPKLCRVRSVQIVGGGMFPRTAILLRELLPHAEITIIDADAAHLEMARGFFTARANWVHERFELTSGVDADLVVIPLSFIGNRDEMYDHPPAPAVLVHDWIWSKRGESVVVCWWLLKRLNLIVR